jgi:hypothetical protein
MPIPVFATGGPGVLLEVVWTVRWKRRAVWGSAALSTWIALACGSADNNFGGPDASTEGGSGGSGADASGNGGTGGMSDGGATGGVGGSGATGGVGGSGATGGAGGSGATGGAGGSGATGGASGGSGAAAACKADVLWALDTSASMVQEWTAVVTTFQTFGEAIVSSGVDAHVVVLASSPSVVGLPGLCVAPPLGSGACPPAGTDSVPPRLFHHPTAVIGSNDELTVILSTFADYRSTSAHLRIRRPSNSQPSSTHSTPRITRPAARAPGRFQRCAPSLRPAADARTAWTKVFYFDSSCRPRGASRPTSARSIPVRSLPN